MLLFGFSVIPWDCIAKAVSKIVLGFSTLPSPTLVLIFPETPGLGTGWLSKPYSRLTGRNISSE